VFTCSLLKNLFYISRTAQSIALKGGFLLYSPKIYPENVISLYHLKQRLQMPMTILANTAIENFIKQMEVIDNDETGSFQPGQTCRSSSAIKETK
jgi:hypothetical protein